MKRVVSIILALAMMLTLFAGLPMPASAKAPRLVDMANLLNDSEKAELTALLDEISTRQQFDVVIVTNDSLNGKSAKAYADDYYDYNGYGYGENYDGVLLLVSMNTREWWMTTTGYGITAINDDGSDYISEHFLSDLSNGDYADAFETFAVLCDDFVTQAKTGDPYDGDHLPKDPDWEKAYFDFIVQDRKNSSLPSDDWQWVEYELIYLDEDTIPELWIDNQIVASGYKLTFFANSGVDSVLLGGAPGVLQYIEKENVFNYSYGRQGFYGDTIYTLENGSLVTCAKGAYRTSINADGTQNWDVLEYTWDGNLVTEETYTKNINTWVDPSVAKSTCSDQSKMYSYEEILDYLSSASSEDSTASRNGLVIYSDYTNLSISTGSFITLSAGILVDGERIDDVSGITFQIENASILDVSTTGIKDNCRYVKLKGLQEGTTTVVFNDSNAGYAVKVPITVDTNHYHSYTLSTVPTQYIEKYPTNIYNVNGLYVDSYEYTVNDDQSATVSFDVYNTNYTYGVVEVFDENGNMKDAVLIEKMTSSNTSIKEALWDNIGYLVRDIIDGDLLSYRQESGYSKKTSVSVNIPKNGYIKITTDPDKSLIVGFVNSVDGLMSMASLAGDIKDFDVNSKEFSKKLTKKLLADQVYVELIKDGSDASKKLWKNVGKETFITSESMGSFTDTITKNIDELKLGSIIADTAADFGWDIGENVFTYFAGPAGTALNIMFTIGKAENLIIQQNDLIQSAGVGSIYIQNQGGGIRACQQIIVKNESGFSEDTALNVFTVTLDSTLMELIEIADPELGKAAKEGTTYTYNISLLQNGEETQPDGTVTVYIPIPEGLKVLAYAGKTSIYRVEENGNSTKMDVEIKDGCFVFSTDHFSLYTIVGFDSDQSEGGDIHSVLGDLDGTGVVDVADIMKLKSCIMTEQWSPDELAVGDLSGNGALDVADIMGIKNIIMAS